VTWLTLAAIEGEVTVVPLQVQIVVKAVGQN
jgi:hypothetical protein